MDDGMVFAGGSGERIPGNKAIWVGIYAELTEFALMFLVYFVARAHHPDAFGAGAQKLSTLAGTLITAIMITNSFLVARAVWEIRLADGRRALYWLTAPLITGLGYPVVKFFEVRWNLSRGLDGGGDPFQMELGDANRVIRRMVRPYGVVIPLLLVLTYVFGPQIASLTSL